MRERLEDTTLPALKMKEGALSQGTQAASGSQKRKETDSPLEPPEGSQPCQHLDFHPVRCILDFGSPELYNNNFLLF